MNLVGVRLSCAEISANLHASSRCNFCSDLIRFIQKSQQIAAKSPGILLALTM